MGHTKFVVYQKDEEEGADMDTKDVKFSGWWIFTDGSCTKHRLCGRFQRAGWAVIQVCRATGALITAIAGPVLREWPQTSPCSEVTAACMATAFADITEQNHHA